MAPFTSSAGAFGAFSDDRAGGLVLNPHRHFDEALDPPVHGGNRVWAAAIAGCPPEELIDFSASINPLGPPQSILEAIANPQEALRAYPDPTYGALRRAIADHHGIDPSWVMPGNGAAELLTWAARDLAALDAVYVPVPAFGDYGRALRAFGARVKSWLLVGGGDRDWLALPGGPKIGAIVNNPHNPTGFLWSAAVLESLLKRLALVVVDEAFMDFLPDERGWSLVDRLERYPNLVIVRSLTKFYSMPGLRLGYAIAHPDRLRRWNSWRDPWSVNSLAALAGVAALADRSFQQQTWDWLPPSRDRLALALRNLAPDTFKPFASAANFLLVRSAIPGPWLQRDLLRRDRLLVRDCLSFPELGSQYLRLAVRTDPENQRLIRALVAAYRRFVEEGASDGTMG